MRVDRDQEFFLSVLDYNAETGVLIWKERSDEMFRTSLDRKRWNRRFAGAQAGYRRRDGYIHVRVFPDMVLAHRVIWFMVEGTWPQTIDHINGNPSDNRRINLRDVPVSENAVNKPAQRNSPLGMPGVFKSTITENRWVARIGKGGQHFHLGTFDSLEKACDARHKAEEELKFHPNHGRKAQ